MRVNRTSSYPRWRPQCSSALNPSALQKHTRTQSYTHHRSTSAAPAWLLALAHTCVAGAGGPLGRHAVPLQVCVRDGQQVVAVDGAAQARLGVQQAAGVAGGEGHAHVVVGGGQTLLGRDHGQVSVAGAGGGWWCGTGWGCWVATHADPLSVDHQVDVFVDFAILVVRLWALASRVVGLDVGAVAAV